MTKWNTPSFLSIEVLDCLFIYLKGSLVGFSKVYCISTRTPGEWGFISGSSDLFDELPHFMASHLHVHYSSQIMRFCTYPIC